MTVRAISLMIKGTVEEAERALADHGIHPLDWLKPPLLVRTLSHHVVSVVVVKPENEPGVARWMAEMPERTPYPVGTLLHCVLIPDDSPSV